MVGRKGRAGIPGRVLLQLFQTEMKVTWIKKQMLFDLGWVYILINTL
jgi:hypothetical protein